MSINDMSAQEDLVSVIIPVFNSEPYLNRCLQSVAGQSYRNLEIILINDASLDDSLRICRKWGEVDNRIKVYNHKVNTGQGAARDEGVSLSTGKYFVFIDADDSVEREFVELMYRSVSGRGADFGICDMDYVREDEDKKEHRIRRESFVLEESYSKKEGDLSGWNETSLSLCARIYQRRFWDYCKIKQMGRGFCEDVIASMILLYHARYVAQVRRVLYHYYQNGDSTVHSEGYSNIIKNTLGVLGGGRFYRKFGKEAMNRYVIKCLSARIIGINEFSDSRQKDGKEEELLNFFKQAFSPENDIAWKECVVFGSYSLRAVVRSYRYFMPEAYGFSSLISLMSQPINYDLVTHSNEFRRQALEAELKKRVVERLQDLQVKLLFLDFMEERYGVLEMDQGGFLTYSDALREAKFTSGSRALREIEACSEEYFSLWKDACVSFARYLKELDVTVIIIQNRLTKEYGDLDSEKHAFENQSWIARVNHQCEQMERFFMGIFPDVICVSAEDKYFYTDEAYPYGCYPWHMNSHWYYEMGCKVYGELEKEYRGGKDESKGFNCYSSL